MQQLLSDIRQWYNGFPVPICVFTTPFLLKSSVYQDEQAAALIQPHTKLAQAALQQIKDKQYGVKYTGKGKPVTLVGAVFTMNTLQGQPVRQVTAWVSEEL